MRKIIMRVCAVLLVLLVPIALLSAGGGAEAAVIGADEFRAAFLNGELTWDDVLSRAVVEGQVNWFHWGGSDELNTWIDTTVAPGLADLGITLQTSRIANTRDAVDQVIADNAAGFGMGEGAVDAIWINGENFRTLASQDLLFGSFADKLPNSRYFYFDTAVEASGVNLADLGYPTNAQEVPWSGAQYICFIDTARLSAADAPADYEELEAWLRANSGRFTYVRPPNFIGNTFVQGVLYGHNSNGSGPFQRSADTFSAAEFARLVAPGFEYLRNLEPFLLGGGGSDGDRGSPIYPETPAANEAQFTNGEVDMACVFGIYNVAVRVENGTFADSVQNIIFPGSGMIANKNFISIPANSPNPAAALVLANLLSDPANQISKLNTIGYPLGVDAALLSSADQDRVESAAPPLYGVTHEQLSAATVPDTNASLVDIIETIWVEYIQQNSSDPLETIVQRAFDNR